MLKLAAAAVLGLGASVHAASPSIEWTGCAANSLIQCGTYQVPLDYANTSAGYATLAVARYKSYRTPRMGTIFANPGGPGGSGTDLIQNGFGEQMSNDTNGQYDIVSWDPRGVNLSTPAISCGFTTTREFISFWGNSIPGTGIQARGNFTDQRDIDYFYSQLDDTEAKITALGQRCAEFDGEFLKYMGSAAVARDIINLSDYLEGPGKKINYWGISYGTIIGSYLINMFPDRVGRIIIDGVVDVTVHATQPSYKMWSHNSQSVEATFAGFTQTCAAAGPSGCAIAEKGSTPESIAQWVRDLIDATYEINNPDIPSSFLLRNQILEAMYTPKEWVDLAEGLAQLAYNITSLSSTRSAKRAAGGSVLTEGVNLVPGLILSMTITCLDSIDQSDVTMKQVFDELLRVTHEETPMFGELMVEVPGFYCHRFPVRAVERFTGPFNHTLSYPILVIGNEADPITPFASAKVVADLLENSAYLVEQDDYGHSSLAERSDCTRSVISDYFLKGTLPQKSKFCGTNQVLFPGPGVTKGSVTDGVSNPDGATDVQVSALKRDRTTFLAVASLLAVLSFALAVALVITCSQNRKNKRYAAPPVAAAYVTTHEYSGGKGSIDGHQQYYSDPWEVKPAY